MMTLTNMELLAGVLGLLAMGMAGGWLIGSSQLVEERRGRVEAMDREYHRGLQRGREEGRRGGWDGGTIRQSDSQKVRQSEGEDAP